MLNRILFILFFVFIAVPLISIESVIRFPCEIVTWIVYGKSKVLNRFYTFEIMNKLFPNIDS